MAKDLVHDRTSNNSNEQHLSSEFVSCRPAGLAALARRKQPTFSLPGEEGGKEPQTISIQHIRLLGWRSESKIIRQQSGETHLLDIYLLFRRQHRGIGINWSR